MTTKTEVLRLFKRYPKATSAELAAKLKCHPAYVRATLLRNGLKLVRGGYVGPRSVPELIAYRARVAQRIAKASKTLKKIDRKLERMAA